MDKGLELLFDYTKFHIGVYLTLTAAYITVATSKFSDKLPKLPPTFVWTAVAFISLAGFAGGVITSSITQTESKKVKEFLEEPAGPWNWTWEFMPVRRWIYLEHTAFWIGVVCVLLSFAMHS